MKEKNLVTSAWWKNDDIAIYNESAWDFVTCLEDESVDCIVTSPPYWKLRNYKADGQWGQEKTVGAYVDNIVYFFGALRNKLKEDGTLWLNLGDTRVDRQLCGIPWRVALDMQTDGWNLRQSVIWQKPNGLPEPVKDRPSGNYEHLFLMSKNSHHKFNLDPIRVQYSGDRSASRRARTGNVNKETSAKARWSGEHNGRNPGSVWSVSVQPFKGAHSAVMPSKLAEMCILSGSDEGDLVCDPFHGSGTTAMVAHASGRRYVGNDISEEYLKLSMSTRLKGVA